MAEKKYRYWIRSGLFTGFQNLSIVAFGAANFIFLTRITSKEIFGTWALFLIIANIIETSKNGLLKNGMMRFINTSTDEDHARIASSSLVLNGILTLTIAVLILILAGTIAAFCRMPEMTHMLGLYCIALAAHILFSHCEFTQASYLSFKGISLAYFTRQAALFAYILFCWARHIPVGLDQLVWCYIIAMILGTGVSLAFARKWLRPFHFSKTWLVTLWKYGRYVFGTNICSLIFRSTDHFIVASYISAAAVGMYNTAVRITNFVDMPSNILSDILFPRSSKSLVQEGPDKVKYLYEKSVGVVLALAVPASVVIFIFPKLILGLLAGKKYLDSAPVLRVTLAFGLFLPFLRQFGTIMDSTGKPAINFLVNLGTAIFNVGSNLFFTFRFGLLGAAYGTILSYFLCFCTGQYILYRQLRASLGNIFKFAWGFYPEAVGLLRGWVSRSQEAVIESIESEISPHG